MSQVNLLLCSSSRVHGSEFLEHCAGAITKHFESADEVLFVPYALADHDKYEDLVKSAFAKMGLELKSIHHAVDPVIAVKEAKGIFVGGGNSFRLLKRLHDLNLIPAIVEKVESGMPYMGSSAGTNMACPTIRTSNDLSLIHI